MPMLCYSSETTRDVILKEPKRLKDLYLAPAATFDDKHLVRLRRMEPGMIDREEGQKRRNIVSDMALNDRNSQSNPLDYPRRSTECG